MSSTVSFVASARGSHSEKRDPRPTFEFDLDLSADQGRNPLHDREAEPEPESEIAARVVDLDELIEDVVQAVLGDADAGVDDVDPDAGATTSGADENGARRGEAQGVLDEVPQRALQQRLVCRDMESARHGAETGGLWPPPERRSSPQAPGAAARVQWVPARPAPRRRPGARRRGWPKPIARNDGRLLFDSRV